MPLCSVLGVKPELLSSHPLPPCTSRDCQEHPLLVVSAPSFRKTPQLGLDPFPPHQQCSPAVPLPRPASCLPPGSSPDVGEEGVDVPGEHGDHVGDDEGGGRPGHQEEGDEGHSPQEAQHRAAARRALRSAGSERGFRAAGRRGPRTC